MSQHNYDQSKCHHTVVALYKCCDAMYTAADKAGKGDLREGGTSTACPVREVVRRKMKHMLEKDP